MLELNLNSDIEISRRNLADIDQSQSDLFEIRKALIKELSDSVSLNKELSFDDLKEQYQEIFDGDVFQEKYFASLSLADRIEFCSFLTKAPKINRLFSEVFFGENEKCNAEAIGKVAYTKNNYTDQAYLMFSKVIPSPRSSWSTCFYLHVFKCNQDVHYNQNVICRPLFSTLQADSLLPEPPGKLNYICVCMRALLLSHV